MKGHDRLKVAMLVLVGLILSGCCHGQWCVGPGAGSKDMGKPPAADNDDRKGTSLP